MKNPPDHKREDILLDAVLAEDPWAEINVAGKSAAMAEFRAAQRRRQVAFWSAQAAAIIVVAVSVAWWLHRPAATKQPMAMAGVVATTTPTSLAPMMAVTLAAQDAVEKPALPAYISEAEMVGLFPRGSCEVVEIDGRKQLVFYDSKIEREGAVYQPGG